MFIHPLDPDYVPEPIYPEYISLEEEEEERPAPADSAVVIPIVEPDSPPEGIEPVIPPSSTDITTTGARITVRLQASISIPPEAEVERLLAMSTPPPSPLTSLSPPYAGERLARMASTQTLVDAVTAVLPSPPLPPSLYIPPPVDHRDDIPESEQPPRKRLCLSTLSSRYEIGESSTARPTGSWGIDYGFVSTVDAEARRQGISEIRYGIRDTWVDPTEEFPEIAPTTLGEVNTRVTELTELHKHDTQDLYALLEDAQDGRTHISQRVAMDSQQVHETRSQIQQTEMAELRDTDRRRKAQMVEILRVMRDMRREMGDMQAELLALRGQQRARQPGPDARIPDHQDASRDADSHIYKTSPMEMEATVHTGITEGMWIEKMESVVNISGCAIENQVKFATCTLLGAALTWWNGQIRTLGPDAYSMTWEVLKKKMADKYCPQDEIKELEIELWNLKVKESDVPAYTERFQELTLICTKFVANETEKVDKYISRLPGNIYGNVKSARPKTLDETIELANDLMD
ncbi:putative reverse transcriptase domain-containing protein [Tanacetum coccineum]